MTESGTIINAESDSFLSRVQWINFLFALRTAISFWRSLRCQCDSFLRKKCNCFYLCTKPLILHVIYNQHLVQGQNRGKPQYSNTSDFVHPEGYKNSCPSRYGITRRLIENLEDRHFPVWAFCRGNRYYNANLTALLKKRKGGGGAVENVVSCCFLVVHKRMEPSHFSLM